jgi:hypothetical protein
VELGDDSFKLIVEPCAEMVDDEAVAFLCGPDGRRPVTSRKSREMSITQ